MIYLNMDRLYLSPEVWEQLLLNKNLPWAVTSSPQAQHQAARAIYLPSASERLTLQSFQWMKSVFFTYHFIWTLHTLLFDTRYRLHYGYCENNENFSFDHLVYETNSYFEAPAVGDLMGTVTDVTETKPIWSRKISTASHEVNLM